MKTKETDIKKVKLPKGFTVDPKLNGKYVNDPFFKDKVERANHIITTTKLPQS